MKQKITPSPHKLSKTSFRNILFFEGFFTFYAKFSMIFLFFCSFPAFYAKSFADFLFFCGFPVFYAKSSADFLFFYRFPGFYTHILQALDFFMHSCYTHIRCKARTRRRPPESCFVCSYKTKVQGACKAVTAYKCAECS